jgi:hypothetical protein
MHLPIRIHRERDPFLVATPLGSRAACLPSAGHQRIAALLSQRADAPTELAVWMQLMKLAAAERELLAKDEKIKQLELQLAISKCANHAESRLASILTDVIGQVVEVSRRLFPGPVSLDYAFDPENPDDEYIVFDVVAHGEYKDYRDREFEWHEEVEKIVPGTLGEFRLSVMPQR